MQQSQLQSQGDSSVLTAHVFNLPRADALSQGRALASAGFVTYAGNHRDSLVQ